MDFKTIYLEARNGRFYTEEMLLAEAAQKQGILPVWIPEKTLARNKVTLTNEMLAAGSVPFVKHALRALGKELPEENSYPDPLGPFLHREVRDLGSLREAKQILDAGRPLFIKPMQLKRFTGFVTYDSYDPRFNGASDRMPVWIAEPVKWLSEWRYYVVNGTIVSMQPAPGTDESIVPDSKVIADAVKLVSLAKIASAYAIDFGVLSTGETALIEMNDGFSIGAYGNINADTYWQVISTRWAELIDAP